MIKASLVRNRKLLSCSKVKRKDLFFPQITLMAPQIYAGIKNERHDTIHASQLQTLNYKLLTCLESFLIILGPLHRVTSLATATSSATTLCLFKDGEFRRFRNSVPTVVAFVNIGRLF